MITRRSKTLAFLLALGLLGAAPSAWLDESWPPGGFLPPADAPLHAGADTWIAYADPLDLDEFVRVTPILNLSPVYQAASRGVDHPARLLSVSYDLTVDGFVIARSSFLRELAGTEVEQQEFSSAIDLRRVPQLSERLARDEEIEVERSYRLVLAPRGERRWGDVMHQNDLELIMFRE